MKQTLLDFELLSSVSRVHLYVKAEEVVKYLKKKTGTIMRVE